MRTMQRTAFTLGVAVAWSMAICSASGASQPGASSPSHLPRVFLLDGSHLERTRSALMRDPNAFSRALQTIRSDGNQALSEGPWSVMDKKHTPPSGDKHDYQSIGPYWWPDPAKPDGLPYIRRDGEVNPQRYEYDNVGLKNTVAGVEKLATAWYFTREARYAERARRLLRSWFLDPDTKMNPHLLYGQAIPGRTAGRGIGIIDTAQLVYLVDAVGLLQSAEVWTPADQGELEAWFQAYLQWLLTSAHGRDEAKTKNNHAVWYDAQVASFALFVGDASTAEEALRQVGPRRIAAQIEPDGRMPLELARTKSFSYTQMNLSGFLHLARLAEHVGVDLWRYRSEDGRSIEAALDWLAPFVAGEEQWTHQQIAAFDVSGAASLYRRAARQLPKPAYEKLAAGTIDPVAALLTPPVAASDAARRNP